MRVFVKSMEEHEVVKSTQNCILHFNSVLPTVIKIIVYLKQNGNYKNINIFSR